MQKLILLLCILCASMSMCLSQSTVTINGTVYDSGTGLGIPLYAMELSIYDSATTTVVMTSNFLTDSTGNYSYNFVASNLPQGVYYGEIHTVDCNGAILSLSFQIPVGSTTYNGFDFTLCQSPGTCTSAFFASSAPGSYAYAFTDFSSTTTGVIQQWAWDMGDGTTSTFQDPLHTFAGPGIYNVCLTTTTSSGCVSTFCDAIDAGNWSPGCTASLTYGQLGSGAIGYTATAAGSGTLIGYLYDFGDGNTLQTNSSTVPYTYINGGLFYACVTAYFSDSCSVQSCINVNAGGTICQADFAAMADTTGQYSLILINNSIGTNLSYLWDFGDGNTSTQAYPQHTYSGPGTYYICLMVVDTPNTCTSTYCDSIVVVNKINTPYTINVVAPGATAAPQPQLFATSVSIHPNPATDAVTLHYQLAQPAVTTLRLTDLSGRTLLTENLGMTTAGQHDHSLDLSALPSGLYFVEWAAGTQVMVQKLVIQ
jgi:PKD repeat protein